MGALGSIFVVALLGRFSFRSLRDTTLATTRITAGMMFMLICAQVFALAFRGLNGEQLVARSLQVVPGGTRRGDLHDAADLRARLLHRVDRNQLHRRAVVPADAAGGERRSRLDGDADRGQSADVVPDAAVRMGAVLSARRRAARGPTVAIYKGVVPFILLQIARRSCSTIRDRDLAAERSAGSALRISLARNIPRQSETALRVFSTTSAGVA